MHLSDALLSPPVALTAGVVAVGLLGIAGSKIRKSENTSYIPLMGVMGAFIFAAQMINFAIPGTGSSGHIVGGVLLAALLGPWAAFITIASVLIIQCLIFSDGGLLALGCNIINMGAISTLIAYPFIYKPILGKYNSMFRLWTASVLACLIGLEGGALLVTIETKLSGITALSTTRFLELMAGIHLPIGIIEGIATAAILSFIAAYRPDLLHREYLSTHKKLDLKKIIIYFCIATVVIGGGLVWFASAQPDGLEWSVFNVTGTEEPEVQNPTIISETASKIVEKTAIMPDYESPLSGIIGALMVLVIVWALSATLFRPKIRSTSNSSSINSDRNS